MTVSSPLNFGIAEFTKLPRHRGLFVTGTDTGVGKTLIAGAIARRLRSAGRRVEVFKPAATGCRRERGVGLVSEDAEFLAACADSRQTLAQITPIRYATAVAPNVAARHERREVDLQAIFDSYSAISADAVVVEGVGGLLCPISDDFWVIHFAKMTGLPLVIIARPGLGTVNHTLLTLHAARSAGINVAGVVVNEYLLEPPFDLPTGVATAPPPSESPPRPEPPIRDDSDIAMFNNPREIAQRGKVEVLAIVPHERENSVREATIGPNTDYCISQVNWEKLMGK